MRRSLALVMAAAVVCSLVVVGVVQHQDATAESHLERARALFATPFADAPELRDIPAADAQAELDLAEEAGLNAGALHHDLDALVHLGRGDLISAEGAMSAARSEAGWTPHRHVLASVIAREAQRTDLALAHITEALALEPDHPRALLQKADLALDADDARTAENALRRLLETAPNVASLHDRRGLALERLGRAEDAEREWRTALELDPERHTAWINLGRIRRAEGDADEAAASFEHALELAPANPQALLGRALCALDRDDLDAAADDFDRVLELAPHETLATIGLADIARARGEVETALSGYREALRSKPTDSATWVKLGNLLFQEDASQSALAYERAVENAPNLAAAHNGLGAARMQLGDEAGAIEALSRAAELDPTDPHPVMNLALYYERAGDEDAARLQWRAALDRDPNAEFARARLARM